MVNSWLQEHVPFMITVPQIQGNISDFRLWTCQLKNIIFGDLGSDNRESTQLEKIE